MIPAELKIDTYYYRAASSDYLPVDINDISLKQLKHEVFIYLIGQKNQLEQMYPDVGGINQKKRFTADRYKNRL